MTKADQNNKKELVIIRIFAAPRELVFKAWTDPDLFRQWWGPQGFTCPVAKMDLRVGGEYFSCMRAPDGKDFWSKGVFREIVIPERLVMSDSFADEHGNLVPATHFGLSPGFPLEMEIAVTFEEHGQQTRLTLKHSGTGGISDKDRMDMEQGWSQSFDKLAAVLKKD